MNIIDGLKSMVAKSNSGKQVEYLPDQWHMRGGSVDRMESDDYENAYSNMHKIGQGFKDIEPFLRDSKGERQYDLSHNVLQRLYAPNQDLSDDEFREGLALKWLTHRRFYVRVHYKGARRKNGTIPDDKITGFTFLENVNPVTVGGKTTYYMDGKTLDSSEVMVFGGMNPYNVTTGYAPMDALRRWTRIEDFMADMQSAHFRNGAVPAGMFIITAPTKDQFMDIRNMLQRKHRGAKNSNNVMYNWRQPDPSNTTVSHDQIVWVPFNTTNKDLALKDIHEIIDKKISRTVAVPAVINGDVNETTYASATVVEYYFMKYTVQPLAKSIWRRFSHELARITGGFGYSIGFELELPILGDELIQRANARKVDAETILMLSKNYETESIIDAFGMDEGYKKLVPVGAPVQSENDELNPNAAVDGQGNKEVRQKSKPFFSSKAKRDIKAGTALGTILLKFTMDDVERQAMAYLDSFIMPSVDPKQNARLYDILTSNLKNIFAKEGEAAFKEAIKDIPAEFFDGKRPKNYTSSEYLKRYYQWYHDKVAADYNAQTRDLIRETIEKGISKNWSVDTLRENLEKLGLEQYRADRLAVSELSRAQNMAKADAHRVIAERMPDHYFVKKWHAGGNDPCSVCLALHGTETHLDGTYLPSGNSINDKDGKPFVNTYIDIKTSNAHPHCHCDEIFELRRYDGKPVSEAERREAEKLAKKLTK